MFHWLTIINHFDVTVSGNKGDDADDNGVGSSHGLKYRVVICVLFVSGFNIVNSCIIMDDDDDDADDDSFPSDFVASCTNVLVSVTFAIVPFTVSNDETIFKCVFPTASSVVANCFLGRSSGFR